MFGLFDSLEKLTRNVVDIVGAPLEIAVDLTNTILEPVVEAAKEIKDEFKSN